jgi:tetratricopeptide (TPR) repeat protein
LNAYLYVGDYDRFLESLPPSEDAPLILFYRGFAEYHLRNWTTAQAYFARAYALDATMLQARIGRALDLGLSGNAADGLALLHEVETTAAERGVGDPEALYKIAEAYAVLGEPGAALRVLGRSIEGGFFAAPYFERDPLLEPLRGQSGWQPLLEAARRRHQAFRARFF